jgi:hypothetical protein
MPDRGFKRLSLRAREIGGFPLERDRCVLLWLCNGRASVRSRKLESSVSPSASWYRKHFELDRQTLGKRVAIQFDGVFMNPDGWLNCHPLGNQPYGYTAFAYDLTDYLNPTPKRRTSSLCACAIREE